MDDYIKSLLELGVCVIPLKPNSKIPFTEHLSKTKTPWNEQDLPSLKKFWKANKNESLNYGWLLPDDVAVLDIDFFDKSGKKNKDAYKFYQEFEEEFTNLQGKRTTRGYHYYFKLTEPLPSISKGGVELLTHKKQVVIYPSKGKDIVSEPFSPHEDLLLNRNRFPDFPNNLKTYLVPDKKPQPEQTQAPAPGSAEHEHEQSIPSDEKIQKALDAVPADEYQTWVTVGMALNHFGKSQGDLHHCLELFIKWSKTSDKFKSMSDCKRKWNSFKHDDTDENTITINSLFHLALTHSNDEEFSTIDLVEVSIPDEMLDYVEQPEPLSVLNLKTDTNTDKIKGFSDDFYFNFPGILGKMTKEICHYQRDPIPSFAFMASLSVLSLLKASHVTSTFSGYSTPATFYGFCLAQSGAGKNQYKSVISNIVNRLQLQEHFEGNLRSAQGLHGALQRVTPSSPSLIVVHDEAHHLLRAQADRDAPAHIQQIKPKLLELYTAHNDAIYSPGTIVSATEKSKLLPLSFPHVTYIGYGTLIGCNDIMTRENLEMGLVNRVLIFTDYRLPRPLKLDELPITLPEHYKFEKELHSLRESLQMHQLQCLEEHKSNKLHVPYSRQAYSRMVDYANEKADQIQKWAKSSKNNNQDLIVLHARAVETVNRLALIGSSVEIIGIEIVQKCIDIVEQHLAGLTPHIDRLLEEGAQYDLDDLFQVLVRRMQVLKTDTLTWRDISHSLRGRSKYRVKKQLDNAISIGEICKRNRKTDKKGGRPTIEYYFPVFDEE